MPRAPAVWLARGKRYALEGFRDSTRPSNAANPFYAKLSQQNMAHKSAQFVYLRNAFAASHFKQTGSDNFEWSLTIRLRILRCCFQSNDLD